MSSRTRYDELRRQRDRGNRRAAWTAFVAMGVFFAGLYIISIFEDNTSRHPGVDTEVQTIHHERSGKHVFWKFTDPEHLEQAKQEVRSSAQRKERELRAQGLDPEIVPTDVVNADQKIYLARVHVHY